MGEAADVNKQPYNGQNKPKPAIVRHVNYALPRLSGTILSYDTDIGKLFAQSKKKDKSNEEKFIDMFSVGNISNIKYIGSEDFVYMRGDSKEKGVTDVFSVNKGNKELIVFQENYFPENNSQINLPILSIIYCKDTGTIVHVDNCAELDKINKKDDVRLTSYESFEKDPHTGFFYPHDQRFFDSLTRTFHELRGVKYASSNVPRVSDDLKKLKEGLWDDIFYIFENEDKTNKNKAK
ncbi:MAG: hypothetical protein V1870_04145 [Candidatus Aenigmatarchaeota archaeon]